MTTALVITPPGSQAPPLEAELRAAGVHVLGAATCDKLVREALQRGPDVVVCWEPMPDDVLFQATAMLAATQPRPVLVFTTDVGVEAMDRALASGIHVWCVQGYGANRLRPLLQLAQARFRHEAALREALADLQHRYDERKLVDRAKGILMRAHQIPEDEAFRRLRTASMQGKQRVGQVSQQVIHAARDAEAVNRAGQLRMLSQRLVKLYALVAAGTDAVDGPALLAESVARVEHNVEHLSRALSKPTFGDLLDAVVQAWGALQPMLASAAVAGLEAVDRCAEQLLHAADRLTAALEAASPVTTLNVVNLSGRQRMLVQRLAKQALIGTLLDGPVAASARAEALETLQAFDRALQRLGEAPLSSAEIRVELGVARREWQALRQGLPQVAQAEGLRQLALSSESLLQRFDRLTEQYERSVQLLLDPPPA